MLRQTKILRNLLAGCCTTGIMLYSSVAVSASDFILHIPVHFEHLSAAVFGGSVRCLVSRVPLRDPNRLVSTNVMGRGNADFLLVNGVINQNIRVRIIPGGYPPGSNPIPDARSYSCSVFLRYQCTSSTGGLGRCETGRNFSASAPAAAALFTSAPGTPRVGVVEGDIDSSRAQTAPRRFW